MDHTWQPLITTGGILLFAFLSCLLLPAPALTIELAQELASMLRLPNINQLYILIYCVWFLIIGTVEYFILRFVWRRWFSIQRL